MKDDLSKPEAKAPVITAAETKVVGPELDLPTSALWRRKEIESPCVKLCVVHPEERICIGCFRSIEEISRWSRMEPTERAAVLADLPNRAPRLHKRRGGRMGRLDR